MGDGGRGSGGRRGGLFRHEPPADLAEALVFARAALAAGPGLAGRSGRGLLLRAWRSSAGCGTLVREFRAGSRTWRARPADERIAVALLDGHRTGFLAAEALHRPMFRLVGDASCTTRPPNYEAW